MKNQHHPQLNIPCSQTLGTQQPLQKNFQHPQAQNLQQPQNFHHSQSFYIPDHYAEQIHLRKEWDEKMERLNDKYSQDSIMYGFSTTEVIFIS